MSLTTIGKVSSGVAEEQAALRRVATLVAGGAVPERVFAAVTHEVGELLPVDFAIMGRYDPGDTITTVAGWGAPAAQFPVGSRASLEGKNLVTIVHDTGRSARVDGYEHASGPIGIAGREGGFHSAVGAPVVVDGQVWGVMTVGSTLHNPPLPADTEGRLTQFTELLAMAVANAESRAGLARLAEEQAALRRVATLVADGAAPEKVFAAVTNEVGRLLPVEYAGMGRYEPGATMLHVADFGRTVEDFPVGRRSRLGGRNVATLVFETGRSARIDSYDDASGPIGLTARADGQGPSVGTPIVVEGRLWGVMAAGSRLGQALPAGIEARLTQFTDLVATAIANAESRAGLARLADEQAALRRVATLVAGGMPHDELFAAVAEEVGRLLPGRLRARGPLRPRQRGPRARDLGHHSRSLSRRGDGGVLAEGTLRPSFTRPANRIGSTATKRAPARSVSPGATWASVHRWGRRSSSRAAYGGS